MGRDQVSGWVSRIKFVLGYQVKYKIYWWKYYAVATRMAWLHCESQHLMQLKKLFFINFFLTLNGISVLVKDYVLFFPVKSFEVPIILSTPFQVTSFNTPIRLYCSRISISPYKMTILRDFSDYIAHICRYCRGDHGYYTNIKLLRAFDERG